MLVHVQEEIPSETTPQDAVLTYIHEFSATLYLYKVLAQQQTRLIDINWRDS